MKMNNIDDTNYNINDEVEKVDSMSHESSVRSESPIVNKVTVDARSELTTGITNVVAPNEFSKTIDEAKIKIVKDAQDNDEKFVTDIRTKLKNAALASAELEESKAELEKQHIEYHSEVLETEQLRNEHAQDQDAWANKRARRQFHYDGVKPIMEFVGIKSPMNLVALYIFTVLISPFFMLNKLLKGTIGALIAGAQDEDRSKVAKGVLWTMVCILFAILIAFVVVLLLRIFGIDLIESLQPVE